MRQNPGRTVHTIVYWQLVPLHLINDICFGLVYQYILDKIKVFSKKKKKNVITCFAAANCVIRGKFD